MRYILRYFIKSKYLHSTRLVEKDFYNMKEIREFLIQNFGIIRNFEIYKLTNLSDE